MAISYTVKYSLSRPPSNFIPKNYQREIKTFVHLGLGQEDS